MSEVHSTNQVTLPYLQNSSVDSLAAGDRVGRLVILSKIGEGGMGVVFAAHDPQLDRRVAVKMLRPEIGGWARSQILREGQTLAQLNHPNIVAVYDVGTWGDGVWIAMEFVEGKTLAEWLRETFRPWREVVQVFRQAIEGLAAAHGRGILHHDFKLSNVMIGEDKRVRVLDFGLARMRADSSEGEPVPHLKTSDAISSFSEASDMVGTPAYMAPEQFLRFPASERSDQYSVCVALWRALYGVMPFVADTPAALEFVVTTGTISPPPTNTRVPRWLRLVVEQGLSARPENRYTSLHDLASALDSDPRPRRWLTGLVFLLAVAGGGLIAGQRINHQRAVAACKSEAAVIDENWNDEARSVLSEALLGSGAVYAGTTTESVTANVDEFVERWKNAAESTCRAETLDGTWDSEFADRARDCLSEQRLLLGSLLQVYSDSTKYPGLIRGAAQTFYNLSDVAICQDKALLLARPMTDDHDWDEHYSVRALLSKGQALRAAGRYEEGLEVAERAKRGAELLGWLPLEAAALQLVGNLHTRTGEHETGERYLEDAFFTAVASGANGIAVTAAHSLAFTVGHEGARMEDSLRWYRAGLAQLDSTKADANDIRRVQLRSIRGIIHGRNEENDEAITLFADVLEKTERRVGSTHPETAEALIHLARAYSQKGDYARAVEMGTRGLEIFEDALGVDHLDVARFTTYLAGDLESLGEYQQALAMHERALAISEAGLGPGHPDVASILLSIGTTLRKTGEYAGAIEVTERAIAILEKVYGPEHSSAATALYSLGIIYGQKEEHGRAIELIEQASEIWRSELGEDHPRVSAAYSGLCIIYEEINEDRRALDYCKRSLDLVVRRLGGEHPNVAYALLPLAEIYRKKGDLDLAMDSIEGALIIWEASLGSGHPNYGRALTVQGEIELERGAFERGLEACSEALDILGTKTMDDPDDLASALLCVARAELQLGAFAGAIEALHRVLALLANKGDCELAEVRFLLAQALAHFPERQREAYLLAAGVLEVYRDAEDDRSLEVARWLRINDDLQ